MEPSDHQAVSATKQRGVTLFLVKIIQSATGLGRVFLNADESPLLGNLRVLDQALQDEVVGVIQSPTVLLKNHYILHNLDHHQGETM